MKKIIPLALALLMVVAMAVPAFASTEVMNYKYNTLVLPDIDSIESVDRTLYPYAFIRNLSGNVHVFFCDQKLSSGSQYTLKGNFINYWFDGSVWVFSEIMTNVSSSFARSVVVWANYEVGSVNHDTPILQACDGSTCSATDENHDNICDDCNLPLTFSLRSTEYDYAVSLAEGRAEFGYPFYAIFKDGDRYVIHVSKNIMSSPDGVSLEGQDMMYTTTVANENGSFSLTGWYNGYYGNTDEFVYANHTIANFPLVPPFLETMEGPILEMGQRTQETMLTLALCGVGCLALLIGLSLFGKVLRPYLG